MLPNVFQTNALDACSQFLEVVHTIKSLKNKKSKPLWNSGYVLQIWGKGSNFLHILFFHYVLETAFDLIPSWKHINIITI